MTELPANRDGSTIGLTSRHLHAGDGASRQEREQRVPGERRTIWQSHVVRDKNRWSFHAVIDEYTGHDRRDAD